MATPAAVMSRQKTPMSGARKAEKTSWCAAASANPENYKPGVQLQQVNDVPWFEDTTLAEGTTGGTWFALGRANDLALFAPQDVANSALVRMSDTLAKHTPGQ